MTGLDIGPEIWRAFDDQWYMAAYPKMESRLSSEPTKTMAEVYTEDGVRLRHSPNPYFSEDWYLGAYASVREAVANGVFKSGFEHFCRHGHVDQAPHWLFDPGYYRDQYAKRLGAAFEPAHHGDCYDHFLRIAVHTNNRK